MSRARILFVAEAVTLAHVARMIMLAEGMDKRNWEVLLATDPRYLHMVGKIGFAVQPIWSMPTSKFQRALARGTTIFDTATLERYVQDDIALFERVRPDIIIGDFRASLGISARVMQVPYINVTNAYWSPLAQIRRLVPEYRFVKVLGLPLASLAFRVLQRVGYAHHALPVNRVRKRHHLKTLRYDFREMLKDGDRTCYADLPEIVPVESLTATERYIGPVHWSPPLSLPPWWSAATGPHDPRPVIYVSLGSSGPAEVLQTVLDALGSMPVRVLASSAGHPGSLSLPKNVWLGDLLPGDDACRAASVVVTNGGSPSTYQALGQGRPVIGIATNMDQFLSMAAVEDAGCGRLLRSGSVSTDAIRASVAAVLDDGAMAERASAVAERMARTDCIQVLERVVAELLDEVAYSQHQMGREAIMPVACGGAARDAVPGRAGRSEPR